MDKGKESGKKSVVDRVMDGIIGDITEGKLRPGDKIPTETELCGKYSAGRNSVREAVKMLVAYGVLDIRRADGTYVRENYSQKMLDPMMYSIILQKNDWKDFVDMRAMIDIGTLSLIIRNAQQEACTTQEGEGANAAPDGSYRDLRRLLALMEAELYAEEPSADRIMDLDTQFHDAIAARTKNPQIMTITDYVTKLTIPSRRQTVLRALEENREKQFIELHEQMICVLENREADKVVETVLGHYVLWDQSGEI